MMSETRDCSQQLRIAMLVVDANEVSGLTHRDDEQPSPVVHSAIRNLLDGLKHRTDLQVYVLYGRRSAHEGERRQDGCLHYVPVSYEPAPFIPGMGGAFVGRTWALAKAVRKLKPDLVHGQGTERESGVVAAIAFCPAVLTLHGNMRELARSLGSTRFSYFGLASILERWVLPRVDMVHCISTHTQRSVEPLARAVRVIPNAVAPRFFDVVNQPADHPVVACMAGIAEWKNPRLLVQASDKLQEVFPDAEVHFYGHADPAHPYAASFLKEVEDRPWCHFHGQKGSQELADLLGRATCAVLPSKQENFGLALAEAMVAGVVPLGSKVGGIPDIIEHGVNGWLFDSDDADALGDLLTSVHQKRLRLAEVAAAARANARERFAPDVVAEAHLVMYRDLLDSSKLHD